MGPREYVRTVVAITRELPEFIADRMEFVADRIDRWLREAHGPLEFHGPEGESAAFCRWEPKKSWPCKEWIEADERIAARNSEVR